MKNQDTWNRPELQDCDVLIVDDNPENLKVLGDFLAAQGFNVRIARDGSKAVASAKASPPDLILLDIHMPVMDGYEACQILKATPSLQDIPVIFLSALGETFNVVKGFECGGVDYITKPFELEEVRIRVNTHLQIRRLLVESRAGFRSSFEQSVVGMFHLDLDGRIIAANRRLYGMLGYGPHELHMKAIDALGAAASDSCLTDAVKRIAAGERMEAPVEAEYRKKDGQGVLCRTTLSLVTVGSPRDRYVAGIVEDISAIKHAERSLARQAAALEQAAESIVITDADGIVQYVNPAYEAASGMAQEDCLGRRFPVFDSAHEDGDGQPGEIWRTITSGEPWKGRIAGVRKEGKGYVEEYSITPVRVAGAGIVNYVSVARDITGQLQLEEQLRQAQKMEAIGTLAAGIAHDFNNVLSGIVGFAELALDELPADGSARDSIGEILRASERARELIAQILAFSRHKESRVASIHVQDVVRDTLKLVQRSISPSIEVVAELADDCGPVMADPSGIHQIVMNLCTNAYHSMQGTDGRLNVRITQTEIDKEYLQGHPNLLPGTYIRLEVSDTGHGMDKATMQRIFEPYFTTKGVGKGTGLGLSTVHGIVKSLNGTINVYSEVGVGSTFAILLPVAQREEPSGLPAHTKGTPDISGNERILFVDDEESICLFVEAALSRLGYKVVTLTDPVHALELLKSSPIPFDAVVTDEVMPGIRGTELCSHIWRIKPNLPVILCCGYPAAVRSTPGEEGTFAASLTKPMNVSDLARTIREVVGKKPNGK
ncbi:MAG: response regulator [Candidatus Hydrogenedentes bacterium]|nr:response regulator [Candidatus Hydrogenedentota bacterium]